MSALDQLAERCGIQPSLVDVFGKERITSPGLKRVLLGTMGFAGLWALRSLFKT
jgi:hypothetical protein